MNEKDLENIRLIINGELDGIGENFYGINQMQNNIIARIVRMREDLEKQLGELVELSKFNVNEKCDLAVMQRKEEFHDES